MYRVTAFLLLLSLLSISPCKGADEAAGSKKPSALMSLIKSPIRYIGLRVAVESDSALELRSGEEYSELIVADDDKLAVTRLKFRLAPELATQISSAPEMAGKPVRLIGTVLGPDGGSGPYVIHLDEVSVLDSERKPTQTFRREKSNTTAVEKKTEPAPKPADIAASPPSAKIEPTPPVASTSEPPVIEASAALETKLPEEHAALLDKKYLLIGTVPVLFTLGLGAWWIRPRKKSSTAPGGKKKVDLVAAFESAPIAVNKRDTPEIPSMNPISGASNIAPNASVNARLNRRTR